MWFPNRERCRQALAMPSSRLKLLILTFFLLCVSLNSFGQASFPFVDNFNQGSLNTSNWSISILTGFQDTSIPVSVTNGQLQIGPLDQNTSNSHYNGISSANSFNFTGAFASVQLVQPAASNTGAFTAFAVLSDSNNYYHFYVSGTMLFCEQKIGGTKTILVTVTYNPFAHQFLRIRHDAAAGNVIFETAPGSNGPWVQQFVGTWNTSAVPLTSMHFELKAGTSFPESNPPGTVIFDNFAAAVTVIQ